MNTTQPLYFTSGTRRVRAQFLLPNAVRLTHSQPGAPDFPMDRPWLAHVLLPVEPATDEEARLMVGMSDSAVHIQTREGRPVFREAAPPRFGKQARQIPPGMVLDVPTVEVRRENDFAPDAISLTLAIEAGEGFYGWGEWFNAFRRERGTLKLRIRDAVAMIQGRETYSAIPLFYSSRGYAFWLLNSHPSLWEIDPDHGQMQIDAAGPGADYIVIYGPTFKEILRTYTQLTGRPPLIPRWALGLMVTGYPQEHQNVVAERAREHRQRHLPLDAIILDYHWEERFHNFRWRASLFPDPQSFISGLHSSGYRLGLILTPFINKRTRAFQRWVLNSAANNIPRGLEKEDERALPEYREGLAQGYYAHPEAKWWFGVGGMLDFTNPAAANWFNALMRPRYEEGVAFFKNDDGEYLPRDAASALGLNGREHHNLYGFFYSRALHQGMEALDDRRGFVYARSAWAGSQRFPAIFLGDQKPTFEHIRSTLRAGLNMSLLGFAHWTVDVFGLDGQTTPETHMRYAQWALMAPIARYFWRPPEFDDTRFPWSHGAANEANFRAISELRYRLLPYYYALAWEAHRTGLPPLRPMLLEFQSDARFADSFDQVMLGDRLLLAPVVEAGATSRRIKLPAGTWHDLWSTQSYEGGGEIEYAAPLDRLPVLVRGGSIIPHGPVLQHIPDTHRFAELELHCYPPYPAAFTLYDDDGVSRAYQRGEFATTKITATEDGGRKTIVVGETQGRFSGQPESLRVTVVLHRASKPKDVRVNGEAWEEWEYEENSKCLTIRVGCLASQSTVIQAGTD